MNYTYKGKVTHISDGDTVWISVDLGFSTFIHNQKMRLLGIDAPEITGATKVEGLKAKAFLTTLLIDMDVTIVTHKDKRDKYGRYLVEIYLAGDLESVNDKMLRHNLAIRYPS